MATHPTTLGDWTLDAIRALLTAHVHEGLGFDWKENLHPGQTARFRGNACGMANSGGGFFVLGVTDDRAKPPNERIVGIERRTDVTKLVSDALSTIDPIVPFLVGVPMGIGPDRDVVVIHILGSAAPHMFEGKFLGRLPGSTRVLSTKEVTDLVVQREERIARARLLMLELVEAREAALCVAMSTKTHTIRYIREVDARVLAELHASLLPLLSDAPDLSDDLSRVRALVAIFNYEVGGVRNLLSDPERRIHSHLNQASGVAYHLQYRSERIIQTLAVKFGLEMPKLRNESEAHSSL